MNLRQQKAITELVEKGGSVGAAMRKAGYSKNTAKTPKKLTGTASFKNAVAPVVKRLERIRERLVESLEAKDLTAEKAKDSVDMMAKITHDIQLLSGKATEKTAHSFNDLTNEELEQLAAGS